MFPIFAKCVNYTGGKFVAGVVDSGGNLPLVMVVLTTPAAPVAKFAAGVVDADGGKIATGGVDIGGAP
jgi:hypothetical protein